MRLIADIADWVRGLADAQSWLSWAAPYAHAAPDWALVIPAPALFVMLTLYTVGAARQKAEETHKTFRKGAETLGLVRPEPKTANADHIGALQAQIQQLSEAQQRQIAELSRKLDEQNQKLVAAGLAAPLGQEEKAKRDQAVTDLVAEETPGAKVLEQSVLAGEALDLDALKAEARADAERAAEKWRNIAALARGVNDGEALAAYEEAHRLQPEDFWTCVELSRLYKRWKGDLEAARRAAEAAEQAARTEREQSVAHDELGDVLVLAGDLEGAKSRFEASLAVSERLAEQNKGSAEAQRDVSVSMNKLGDVLVLAGDLEGAKSRFEASLAVRERLAEQNKGSAEAQRDLIVSYAKMADMFPGAGWWGKAHAVATRLAEEGRLAPADEWMVQVTADKAAADSPSPA